MRNTKILLALSTFVVACCSSAIAAPLFQEDFSAGTSFSSAWQVNLGTNGTLNNGEVAIEPVDGDNAAYTKGPTNYENNDWRFNFNGTQTYNRGNGLRCTFQTWRNITKPTWAGTNVNHAINGPWHKTPFAVTAPYTSMEATIGGWAGGGVNHRFSVHGWNNPADNTATPVQTAFMASTDRATSVWVRITLGDTSGGKLEYSTDGTNFTLVEDRTDEAGTLANSEVVLGWCTHASAVFVDNILVEDNDNVLPVEMSEFQIE